VSPLWRQSFLGKLVHVCWGRPWHKQRPWGASDLSFFCSGLVPSEYSFTFVWGNATFDQIGLGALQLPEILCQGLSRVWAKRMWTCCFNHRNNLSFCIYNLIYNVGYQYHAIAKTHCIWENS
jgi:hypothetical protein